MTKKEQLQLLEHFGRAIQMMTSMSALTEDQAMEIATIYPKFQTGKSYKVGDIISHGLNNVGDPQLYKVIQGHTSQVDWAPDISASLFTPIGLDDTGYSVWAQPTGAHDAYNVGDIVCYDGGLYTSLIDGNTYSPKTYPAGWAEYIE